jgi:hypothetical protein
MLDEKKILDEVFSLCQYPCQALKKIPKELLDYQTETKPERAGVSFNCDVMKENKQNVLLMRDNLTNFTETYFIKNEQKATLREGIMILALRLRLNKTISIRVDGQSSLRALQHDTA